MRHSAALLLAVLIASAFPAAQQKPLFTFHSNAWLNLHHYVRSNARGGPAPTGLTDEERAQWAAGVEFYKPYVPRDLNADDGMVAIKTALRGAEGKSSLDGIAIDAALKATLERLMPIYQKRWWPEHDRANREWIAAMRPLVDRHGAALSQALARVYGVSWPREPIPVDLTVTAGASGAYGTSEPSAHITIVSVDVSAGTRRSRCCSTKARTASCRCYQWVSQAAAAAEGDRAAAALARGALLHRRRADDARAEGARHRLHRLGERGVLQHHVRRRLPRQDGQALGSASRRQALDRRRALRARRRVQVEAGLPWPGRSRRQTRLEVTALRSVVWTALFWLPAEAISVNRSTLRESAQRVDEPHLADLRARHVEQLRTAHQDGKRLGSRDGDVEPVAAEEKLQAPRHVLSASMTPSRRRRPALRGPGTCPRSRLRRRRAAPREDSAPACCRARPRECLAR